MTRLIEKNYDKLLQFILIGDSQVGKTAICKRLVTGEPLGSINATIGVDIHMHMLRMGGANIKLQIWDTAGEERYETLTTKYYQKADGVIIVYDVTRKNTFKNVQNWLQMIKLRCKSSVSVILVGNKIDLMSERKVSPSAGRKRAESAKINFLESSAMTGDNINNCFAQLAFSVMGKCGWKVSTPLPTQKLKHSKEALNDTEC